jgi:hypothetical protein
MGNGVECIALFVDQAPLAWGCPKQGTDGCQESIMPICDEQIDLSNSPIAEIL